MCDLDLKDEVLESFQALIIKHMLPVILRVQAQVQAQAQAKVQVQVKAKSSSPKAKSEKGSSKPNYYAAFHSMCSAKGTPYLWSVSDYEFKYQPEPDKLTERQKEIYDALQSDLEKLERVQNYTCDIGDLPGVVKFVEKEFNVSQMSRTALIWNQFMSPEDRDRYSAWYKKTIAEFGEIPMKPYQPKVSIPPVKISARIKPVPAHAAVVDPYEVETEDEAEAEAEKHYDVEAMVPETHESTAAHDPPHETTTAPAHETTASTAAPAHETTALETHETTAPAHETTAPTAPKNKIKIGKRK